MIMRKALGLLFLAFSGWKAFSLYTKHLAISVHSLQICSLLAERLALEISLKRQDTDRLLRKLAAESDFRFLESSSALKKRPAPCGLSEKGLTLYTQMMDELGFGSVSVQNSRLSYYKEAFCLLAQQEIPRLQTARHLLPKLGLGVGLCAGILLL